jgi:hypothetical protein
LIVEVDTELSEERKARKTFVGAAAETPIRIRAEFDLQQALDQQKPVLPAKTENLSGNFE